MKKNKVYVYGANGVAATCREWAQNNTPQRFELVDSAEESNIIISVQCCMEKKKALFLARFLGSAFF